jgi:hypothetical protein
MTQDNATTGEVRSGRSRVIGLAGALLAATAVTGLTGCLAGGHSDKPVLSVDLFWDQAASPSHFTGGTCSDANVSWMDWRLEDETGALVANPDPKNPSDKDCKNGFDFYDLGPGSYTFVVTGYDASDKPVWSSTCTNLDLQRFAASYECDVTR